MLLLSVVFNEGFETQLHLEGCLTVGAALHQESKKGLIQVKLRIVQKHRIELPFHCASQHFVLLKRRFCSHLGDLCFQF